MSKETHSQDSVHYDEFEAFREDALRAYTWKKESLEAYRKPNRMPSFLVIMMDTLPTLRINKFQNDEMIW